MSLEEVSAVEKQVLAATSFAVFNSQPVSPQKLSSFDTLNNLEVCGV